MGSQDPKGRFSYKSAGFRCGSKSLVSTTPSMQHERLELARIEAVLQVQQRFADKENELRLQELELAKKVEAMKIQREGKFSSVDVDKSSMDLSENPGYIISVKITTCTTVEPGGTPARAIYCSQ